MFPLHPTDFSPFLFTLTIILVHYFLYKCKCISDKSTCKLYKMALLTNSLYIVASPEIWNTQQFLRYRPRKWIVLHIPMQKQRDSVLVQHIILTNKEIPASLMESLVMNQTEYRSDSLCLFFHHLVIQNPFPPYQTEKYVYEENRIKMES
jgi:hypothetical protein